MDEILVKVASKTTGNPLIYAVRESQMRTWVCRTMDPEHAATWYGRLVAVKFKGESGWKNPRGPRHDLEWVVASNEKAKAYEEAPWALDVFPIPGASR